jgi:hypothetical protein
MGTDPANLTAPDPAELRAKHFEGTPEDEHEETATIEGSGNLDRSSSDLREEADGGSSPHSERAPTAASGDSKTVTSALLSTSLMRRLRVDPRTTLVAQFGEDDFSLPDPTPPRSQKVQTGAR